MSFYIKDIFEGLDPTNNSPGVQPIYIYKPAPESPLKVPKMEKNGKISVFSIFGRVTEEFFKF